MHDDEQSANESGDDVSASDSVNDSPGEEEQALERRHAAQKRSAERLAEAAVRKPSKKADKRAASARQRANVTGSKASKANLERILPPTATIKKRGGPRL